ETGPHSVSCGAPAVGVRGRRAARLRRGVQRPRQGRRGGRRGDGGGRARGRRRAVVHEAAQREAARGAQGAGDHLHDRGPRGLRGRLVEGPDGRRRHDPWRHGHSQGDLRLGLQREDGHAPAREGRSGLADLLAAVV
ncbi:MAG: hypothetical protein AVDCRST_MAG67-2093, partial [uncultured Solirubrobacteraceae bacterium]